MTLLNTLMAQERRRDLVEAARQAQRTTRPAGRARRLPGRRRNAASTAPVACLPDAR